MSMGPEMCDYCEGKAHGMMFSGSCICGPNVRCSRSIIDCAWGSEKVAAEHEKSEELVWPDYADWQVYVRDQVGVIWLWYYDSGTAVTVASDTPPIVVDINMLRNERGPLYILDKDNEKIWEHCAMLLPDQCEKCDPMTVYSGPFGSGLARHMRSKSVCRKCGRTLGLG